MRLFGGKNSESVRHDLIRRIATRVLGRKGRDSVRGLLQRLKKTAHLGAHKAPLLFLGDSHITYFQKAAERGLFGARESQFCGVVGATAVGLRNPNFSQTNALAQFRQKLATVLPPVAVVIQLGEVDCGFVIWYRAKKYSESVPMQMQQSIDAYFSFVDESLAKGYDRIVITGAVLPTIRDGQDWGEVANIRREVKASLRERTQLTLDYNQRLCLGAAERGIPYIDITDEVLDPNKGEIREEFRNLDPRDHHLRYDRAAECWAIRLNKVLSELESGRG